MRDMEDGENVNENEEKNFRFHDKHHQSVHSVMHAIGLCKKPVREVKQSRKIYIIAILQYSKGIESCDISNGKACKRENKMTRKNKGRKEETREDDH